MYIQNVNINSEEHMGTKGKGNRNNARGNYYRKKSKDWFIARGFQSEYLEVYRSIFRPPPLPRLMIKQDLFGSDGLAINSQKIIFWQSKANHDNSKIKEAFNKFDLYDIPPFVEQWLLVWIPRKKFPMIYVDRVLTDYGETLKEVNFQSNGNQKKDK